MAKPARTGDSWIAVLIGLAIFVAFSGGQIVNPANVDWIMASGGDPIQHYIGWNFFRYGDLLQFPIGLNTKYGEAIGSSIVFSDSIPLLAIPFKFLRAVLTPQFQYFGIWIALCFALQAFFAWRILSLFTDGIVVRAIGAALLTLSPPMLWRLLGHEALIGHWILLAGLYLYLRGLATPFQWIVLLCVAALVHPYLLAMSLGLWTADRWRALRAREVTGKSLTMEIGLAFLLLAGTMISVGYFAVRGVGSEGYGYYRFNITSPLHPLDIWSIWRQTPYVGGNYEGFSYPGAGMFVLALLVVALLAFRWRHARFAWRPAFPLVAVCAIFYVYALSNRIAFGGHELIQFQVPAIFEKVVSTFRSTGRFIWPVLYAVEILLLVLLLRLSPKRLLVPALAVILLFQATDLLNASAFFRARWAQRWDNPLKSAFWNDVPKQYKRIAFVLPLDGGERYAPIAFLASNARMSINGGYFARVDFDKLKAMEDELLAAIETGNFREDTLYIFNKDTYWNKARGTLGGNGFAGYVDGFRVLAPAWRGCTQTCAFRSEIARVDFRDAASERFLKRGWSTTAGEGGRWTDGREAELSIPLGDESLQELSVRLRFIPFIKPGQEQQQVVVVVAGKEIQRWRLTREQVETRELRVPASVLKSTPGSLDVRLEFPDARSPVELGISDDTRVLALNVDSMEIHGR
ncbi:DUF6311 domain-containing protein [Cupriavidus sp. JZ107]